MVFRSTEGSAQCSDLLDVVFRFVSTNCQNSLMSALAPLQVYDMAIGSGGLPQR